MRRRALLSGLLVGGMVVLRAFAVRPLLDIPLAPEDGGEEEPELPPPTEPPPPEPPPLEPDEQEEERPPTEPA